MIRCGLLLSVILLSFSLLSACRTDFTARGYTIIDWIDFIHYGNTSYEAMYNTFLTDPAAVGNRWAK